MAASSPPQSPPTPNGAGIFLGVVQFLFVSTWTVYVAFLPRLAEQVGIGAGTVGWILLLDQLLFLVSDLLAGILADRATRAARRLAPLIAGITAVSCGAFLLLPLVSPLGASQQSLFLALLLVWAATSSALRAPLFALVGKLVPKPAVPWQASLLLLGFGIAAAGAPYLNGLLLGLDPKVPFAIASLALLLASLGIGRVERRLAESPRATPEPAPPPAPPLAPPPAPLRLGLGFLLGMLLMAEGFQLHTALSSPRLYGQFLEPAAVAVWLPAFWIGFNLLVLPVGVLNKRFGGLRVAAAGALLGSVALLAASQAPSLSALTLAQLLAGGAWASVLLSASTTAIELGGGGGREGTLLGALFSTLALATAGRILLTASGSANDPAIAPLLASLPTVGWLLGGLVLALVGVWWGGMRSQGEAQATS